MDSTEPDSERSLPKISIDDDAMELIDAMRPSAASTYAASSSKSPTTSKIPTDTDSKKDPDMLIPTSILPTEPPPPPPKKVRASLVKRLGWPVMTMLLLASGVAWLLLRSR